MSRPKGIPNKPKVEVAIPTTFQSNGVKKVHYDEILGIRNLRTGPFKGLWELVRLNDDGTVRQVLTDANSRGMIITMANRQILKIVIQNAPLQ